MPVFLFVSVTVQVMPEMSVGDFKEQLREHFADSAPRVELIVGDERLVDDNQTVVEAGA